MKRIDHSNKTTAEIIKTATVLKLLICEDSVSSAIKIIETNTITTRMLGKAEIKYTNQWRLKHTITSSLFGMIIAIISN